MSTRRVLSVMLGLALGVVCYYLPWYTHTTAGFTMNAFDLAEWTSLHPAVRSSSPPMLTSFLLRAPQWALVAALALAANLWGDLRARWIVRAAALALALRFIPPKDFFTTATSDPNYRQMALLTGLSVFSAAAAVAIARLGPGRQTWLVAGALVAGALAGWIGLSRAGVLLDNFEIAVQIGPGAFGFSAAAAVVVLAAARRIDVQTKKGG